MDHNQVEPPPEGTGRHGAGLHRRTVLKGIGLGVPVAWAVPQILATTEAGAQTPGSTPCRTLFTVTVPVKGTLVSVGPVVAGVTYQLVASGTFLIGGPGYADAQYAFDAGNGQLQAFCGGDPAGTSLGIFVDATVPETAVAPLWGAFNPSHVYVRSHVAAGTAMTFGYSDCFYPDNNPAVQQPGGGPPPDRAGPGLLKVA